MLKNARAVAKMVPSREIVDRHLVSRPWEGCGGGGGTCLLGLELVSRVLDTVEGLEMVRLLVIG